MKPPNDVRVGNSLHWVSEGQKVWAPRSDGKFVLCRVAVAAGVDARVVNEPHGFDAWRSVYDLWEYRPVKAV
jgi:hypothetical protein